MTQVPEQSDSAGGWLIYLTARPPAVAVMKADGTAARVLVPDCGGTPDGVAIDAAQGYIYWTNMGEDFAQNDSFIERVNLSGENRIRIVRPGATFTPKQIVISRRDDRLYWADREGMRVMRSRSDGTEIETLIETGETEADRREERRHCVGVALDEANGFLYWTQKGAPNAGQGRILRASSELPVGSTPGSRGDVVTLLENLPEPIDLEWDHANGFLYWTDRGDPPGGNTLNRIKITKAGWSDHQILARNLKEGIGLALDLANHRVFTTDLGGDIRVIDLSSFAQIDAFPCHAPLTGIAYVSNSDLQKAPTP